MVLTLSISYFLFVLYNLNLPLYRPFRWYGICFAGSHFYSCDSFRSMVKWNSGSESFKIFNTTGEAEILIKQLDVEAFKFIYGPPCAWTYIYANSAGRSLLHATLQTQSHLLNLPVDSSYVLKAASPIAAYNPLVVIRIGDGDHFGGYSVDRLIEGVGHDMKTLEELYLVPRTKSEIMLVGGPEQWDQGVEFVETVDILDEEQLNDDLVLAGQEPTPKGRLYRVSCLAVGTFVRNFTILFPCLLILSVI